MRTALALVIILFAAASVARADAVETTVSAHIDASPDRVLAVLCDFESWNRVFANVETVLAERQDDHRARIHQRVHRAGYTLSYTLAANVDRAEHRLELALDPTEPGDMDVLQSTWYVAPLSDGSSLVTLRVVTRSRLPLPEFVERHVTQRTSEESLAELVRALERVATSEPSRQG